MKWPWVSRQALDLVIDERDRLRETNDRLVEDLVRITRREHRMPEVPADRRNGGRDRSRVDIPPEIHEEFVAPWGSSPTQRLVESRLRQLYNQDRDWDVVCKKMRKEQES